MGIKPVENTGQLILQASKDIAYTKGLSKVSMRKIAEKCDIALGTIYNYYPTKVDIILAIVEDFWKECFAGLNEKFTSDMNFFEKLEQLYVHIKNYTDRFEENWLHDLSSLPYDSKTKSKERETQISKELIYIFKDMLIMHKEELNKDVFSFYSENEISTFILNNFMIMLKSNNQSYNMFNFVIKKMLT